MLQRIKNKWAGRAISVWEPDGPLLIIHDTDGEPLVTIEADRSLTFGDRYEPDRTATIFWETMARVAGEPGRVKLSYKDEQQTIERVDPQ